MTDAPIEPAPDRSGESEPVPKAATRMGPLRAIRWPRFDGVRQREILIVLALLLCYGFFQQVPIWNENSRYDLVRALVEDGTTQIDRFQDNTGDKAFYNGHYYSDKAPGSSLMGVPVYMLVSLTSRAVGAAAPDPNAAVETLAFAVSGVPTVLLVLLLLRFLSPIVGEPWALVVSIGYALGSLAFPFATMYFGHAATAFLLFAAFYVVWRAKTVGDRAWLFSAAGLLAGWAVLVDISALLGVAVLLIYALVPASSGRPWLIRTQVARPILIVAGAAIPAMVFLAYNWISFGGPFSLGYSNLANRGFADVIGRGILGVTWPSPQAMFDLLFAPRGLVRLAPWFVLAPLGLLAATGKALRQEVLVCGAIVAAFLAANAGFGLPFGGATPGPRFFLPALPFAAVLVALIPRTLRPVAAFLIALGVAVFFVATATMPNALEVWADPLIQLWLPRLLSQEVAQTIAWLRWGIPGIAPLVVLAACLSLTGAALLATFRSGRAPLWFAGVVTAVLSLAVLAFAFPLWPPTAFASNGAADRPIGSIAIRATGVTPVMTGDIMNVRIWAQFENEGPAVDDTRVEFDVRTPDGGPAWTAWHPSVSWAAGERRTLSVEWGTKNVSAGDYGVGIRVVANTQTVYLDAPDATVVRVGALPLSDVFGSRWLWILVGVISAGLFARGTWQLRSTFAPLPQRVRRAYAAMDERWNFRRLVPDAGTALLIVLAVALLLRAAWLSLPQGAFIFDEAYYVNAAHVIAGIHPTPGAHYADQPLFLDPNTEHPPLGKVLMAGSILLVGDNGLGWRIPSLVAGMVALLALYGVVRAAGGRPWLGVLAVAIYSLDILSLIHGRIGTLDMMSVAFLLVGAWLGLKERWALAGAALALGTLIKVPGVYGLLAALLWQGYGLWRAARLRPGRWRDLTWRDLAPTGVLLGTYAFVGLAGLWLLDLKFTTYANPLDHINHMLGYGFALQGAFNPTGGITSAPWQWLVNDGQFDYLKTAVNTLSGGNVIGSKVTIEFRAMLNPVLIGSAPLAVLFGLWLAWRRGEALVTWGLLWIAANYLPYWELALVSNRITYFYYILPVIPGLAVVTAAFLVHSRLPRFVLWGYLAASIVGLIAFYPFRQVP